MLHNAIIFFLKDVIGSSIYCDNRCCAQPYYYYITRYFYVVITISIHRDISLSEDD